MDKSFEIFDFHRIFIGDAPLAFLLEIIFRTCIMYGYTVFLLRILGKRGMGQLSVLELAIIISFGSAVGDPMIMAEVPILHGMTAITVVTVFQISLEYLINKSKKAEVIMEGAPSLVVEDGIIKWDNLVKDNMSKEDLLRSLRGKDVEHLGQIYKAFLETSGQVSVMFHPPKNIKPGLSVIPEHEIPPAAFLKKRTRVKEAGIYCCMNSGNANPFDKKEEIPACELCGEEKWLNVKF
ncbi:MAG: DUF421 domain-containing protein [Saprospiraceae bacterium]|nr:DUF421 domain-containing protein [Saprospiraceae bacterium]